MVATGSGNIEATQQEQQSAAYQAYIKYKQTSQPVNASDNYTYTNEEKPQYYGKTAPVLQTARDVLAKRDEQAKSATLQENVIVSANDPEKVTSYSEGTKAFNIQTEKNIAFLQTAKEAGVTEIDFFNQKGEKIGQTNPQDITRARYDLLKASIKEGAPIKFSYEKKATNYSVSLTEGNAPKEKPETATLYGKTFPIYTPKQSQDNEAVSFLKFPFIGEKSSSSNIPSTSLANVAAFLPLGSNTIEFLYSVPEEVLARSAKTSSSIGSQLAAKLMLSKTESTMSRIQSALRENNLIIGTEKTANPKVSLISQGTVSKSGIEYFTPEKASINKENFKLSPGAEEGEKPPLPGNIKEKETILTVGSKGEAKPVEVTATIRLEKGLEGQAKVPLTVLETTKKGTALPEGKILLVRSEAQESLPVNAVLVFFQGVSKKVEAEQVQLYGLKPTPEGKGAYYGKLTPDLAEKLNIDIKGEAAITGTDLFEFSEKDFLKNKEPIVAMTRNPELFQMKKIKINADVGENLSIEDPFVVKSNNAPEISRPFVIRTIEFKGYAKTSTNYGKTFPKIEPKPQQEENPSFPKQSMEEVRDRYPLATSFEPSQIGTGEPIKLEMGKTNPEAASSVADLFTKSRQESEVLKTTVEKPGSKAKTENDFIFETLQFPPKTTTNSNQRLTNITTSRTELISSNKTLEELNTNILVSTTTKSKIKERQDQSMNELFNLGQNQSSSTKQSQSTQQSTTQQTKQQTEQIQQLFSGEVNPPRTREQPQKTPPFLILNSNQKPKKKEKSKGKKSILFLGNVPQYDIIGIYKREDVIYNEKKINKISRKEKTQAGKYGKVEFIKTKKFKVKRIKF